LSLSLLIFQFGFIPERGSRPEETNPSEDGGKVYVGEMYFRQNDPNQPRNNLRFSEGDTIEFYNEGAVPHTVTIEEFDFDEIINPGETAVFKADRASGKISVICRFHPGHRAVMTIEPREQTE